MFIYVVSEGVALETMGPLHLQVAPLALCWDRWSIVWDEAKQVQEERMGRWLTGHKYDAFAFCKNVEHCKPAPKTVIAGTLRFGIPCKPLTMLSPAWGSWDTHLGQSLDASVLIYTVHNVWCSQTC